MFTSKTFFVASVLLIAAAMTSRPAIVKADRSFYAPGPVNYPGLLPRFGGGNSAASQPPVGSRGGDSLGTRIGDSFEDYDGYQRIRPSRPSPSPSSSSFGCPQQRVPCYDCVVYISRSGQITRFTPSGQNNLIR